MRSSKPLPLLVALVLVSCKESGPKWVPPSQGTPAPETGSATGSATAPPAEQPAAKQTFVEGKDYVVLERVRFMDDQGFEQPAEAFSVLLPKGWTTDGGVVWKSLQECRGELVSARWSAASPDGEIRFSSLPVHTWGSASDPVMQQVMATAARSGGCETGEVMPAEQYLREVLGPRELQGASIVDVTSNDAAVRELDQQMERTRAMIARYGGRADIDNSAVIARLRWPDGTEGIALTSVSNVVTSTAGQTVTTSVSAERSFVRFPAARKDESERVLATLKASVRTNPEWKQAIDGLFEQLRQQQNVMHRQKLAAIDAQTRANTAAHNQRMRDIQAWGAANTARHEDRMAGMDRQMRSWESQQSSQDRMHRAFVQTIREVETYQDAGGKVELTGGYGQAWSRGDGTYILSNTPSFDPSSAFQDPSWKEMKKADP